MSSSRRPALEGFHRSADERATTGLLDEATVDDASHVLVIAGDAAPLDEPGRLHWRAPADVPEGAEWAFLGRDGTGAAVLAAVFAQADDEPFEAPGGWAGLRVVGGALPAREAEIFVEALSLGRWLLDAPYCPACGTRTRGENAGWSRRCPHCGREHFPRTDPAVIVAITSARHPDLLLLGSNALWGANRYSCFAGFAEAGESLESAVHREVHEEAGVEVEDVRYRGSQAWPYPRSLMLGFLATAIDDEAARADGEEIAAVRWFTRDEIGEALAGGGDVLLPGTASIAHRLISEWHAGTS
ncbi:NAD(+) diphosphatase [Microbacterium aoyamense]|uniref:NAD(+) diphosphatase n=1 Tax=Microbacterium aoyamense TaxID=344166 RepID=A0ABN2PX31_9MICO|nr:NAD(+) diphosphatase [Microbacterium aoyamense]